MPATFREKISTEALLARSWLWTRTNTELLFKNYFRSSYSAYALAASENLRDLRTRIRAGEFRPSPAIKVYVPKPSGGLRIISLLTVEDQIVYMACTALIAERLFKKVGRRYEQTVFGNLYAGSRSKFFYRRWQTCYQLFSDAIRRAFNAGYVFGASFDLTACYDTIDHKVLAHFLGRLKFEPEFIDFFCELLHHWTAVDSEAPIRHGHGIPQGPLPSGLVAELLLGYFDERLEKIKGIRFARYVDDIRLYARDEHTLRRALIQLELASKDIGLFPQSSKINVRRVVDVEDEIKSVSTVIPLVRRAGGVPSKDVTTRILELIRRGTVLDETKLKFLLPHAKKSSRLDGKMLDLLRAKPHLFLSICAYFRSQKGLSKKVSAELIGMLAEFEMYPSVVSSIITTLKLGCHPEFQGLAVAGVRKVILRIEPWQWEQRHVARGYLLEKDLVGWSAIKAYVVDNRNWYSKSNLVHRVQNTTIGDPSYDSIINSIVREDETEVALAAAHVILLKGVKVSAPISAVNKVAQHALRDAGVIGRVASSRCLVLNIMVEVLGTRASTVRWREILGSHYKLFLSKLAQWRGYSDSDPNGFVNLTDTLCDLLMDSLYKHSPSLGSYSLGNIGSILGGAPGRLGATFPHTYLNLKRIHYLRLESDLSHPFVRATGKATRRISHREVDNVKVQLLVIAEEISQSW